MQVTYFNDEKNPLRICINSFDNSITLCPLQMKTFDIDVLEGQGLFIKSWDNGTVFISTCEDINERD